MLQSRGARVAHIAITVGALVIAVVAALDGSWAAAIGSSAAFLSLVLSFLAFRTLRRQAQNAPR